MLVMTNFEWNNYNVFVTFRYKINLICRHWFILQLRHLILAIIVINILYLLSVFENKRRKIRFDMDVQVILDLNKFKWRENISMHSTMKEKCKY